ncbi:hypothetical protein Ancab_031578 [Ancistrocladus abbreviatus]
MAFGPIFQCLCLSILLFSLTSLAKIGPRFPASVIPRPEQLALITKGKQLYETRYYTQILDHFNFNPQSYQTFQQRYLINSQYWGGAEKNAPIFVYTGNEGDIEWFAQNTGFMFEIAPSFQALLVFIEHRFYGKSIPYGDDKTVAYENATTQGYLSSTQALADYATLILNLKNNLTAAESPVVVFGGSYGGMLAAWFRLKYPHVAVGALASSSPILSFDGLTSPYTFNNIITQDFRGESENCYKVIKDSWQEIQLTANQPGGLGRLAASFKLCQTLDSVDSLTSWLYSAYAYTAMTDYPTPANFLNPMPAYPVKEMCKAIDNPTWGNDTFAKLYGAVNIYYNYTGKKECNELNRTDAHGLDEWIWQACTEMVQPTDGNNEESIFPVSTYNYTARVAYCRNAFGIDPRPHWITTEYGGYDFRRVLRRYGSNIIFFNGMRDPWSGGGVLYNISENLIAIVAKEGAHHVDLRYSTGEDPQWLQDVRKTEVQIIRTWLAQYYLDLAHFSI